MILVFLFFAANAFSCKEKESSQFGICLSFDDNYFEQWVEILPLLDTYDVKATFFVTGVGKLNNQEKAWLEQIKEAGHEIGAHGENHLPMNSYIKENGLKMYWQKEIKEHLDEFHKLNIEPKVFAYPYGEKNFYIDFFILPYFKATRNVASNKGEIRDISSIYFRPGSFRKHFYSLGIDNIKAVTNRDLLDAFQKAKDQNEVIFLHAHRIGDGSGYEINVERLSNLLILAKKDKMSFYTYSELISW